MNGAPRVGSLANLEFIVEPVLSGRLSNSRIFFLLSIITLTTFQRWSLLSGCGHPLLRPIGLFGLYGTVALGGITRMKRRIVSEVKFIPYLSPKINVTI